MMDPTTARNVLTTSSGWFKSSHSEGANACVELNLSVAGYAGMRDSKLGQASPVLLFTAHQLTAFLNAMKNS
jgi:hypothetical protein